LQNKLINPGAGMALGYLRVARTGPDSSYFQDLPPSVTKRSRNMSLECIVQEAVDIVTPAESAFQAAERMHQRTVGCLVVVDSRNVPIGILTDRDLMIRIIAAGRDAYTTSVREVMTPAPRTISRNATVRAALATMRSRNFRRLPVVNDLGHLTGLVALDDILMLLAREMHEIGSIIKQETPQAAGQTAGAL
jgi:CBS domain-containing protein